MKKHLFSALAVLVLLFAGASTASAQNGPFAPYVVASISGSSVGSVLSTTNPNYSVGGGVESSTSHLLLDINAQFSGGFAALKGLASNSGGYNVTLTGSAYYRTHGFLLGGGLFYANQVAPGVTIQNTAQTLFATISNNRNQVRPFVGIGYQFSHDRIILNYVLPGLDNTGGAAVCSTGGVTGAGASTTSTGTCTPLASTPNDKTVNISNEIFLGTSGIRGHLRLTQNFSVSTNDTFAQIASNKLAFVNGATYTGGGGLKVVF
jgi:hypothetical protein